MNILDYLRDSGRDSSHDSRLTPSSQTTHQTFKLSNLQTFKPFFLSGQAFIELAVGMFVLSLVLSALFAFASVIVGSLDAQRTVRAEAGENAMVAIGPSGSYSSSKSSDTVHIDPLPATYIFGSEAVHIDEQAHIPYMRIDE